MHSCKVLMKVKKTELLGLGCWASPSARHYSLRLGAVERVAVVCVVPLQESKGSTRGRSPVLYVTNSNERRSRL
jgi:hypothetical protein